jgi:hypothetical protein
MEATRVDPHTSRGERLAVLVLLVMLMAGVPVRAGALGEHATSQDGSQAQVVIPDSIPVRRAHPETAARPPLLRALVAIVALVIVAGAVVVKYRLPPVASARTRFAAARRWPWRRGRGPQGDAVELLHSARLDPRTSVHLIRWGRRELLVGNGQSGLSVLDRRDVEPDAVSAAVEPEANP